MVTSWQIPAWTATHYRLYDLSYLGLDKAMPLASRRCSAHVKHVVKIKANLHHKRQAMPLWLCTSHDQSMVIMLCGLLEVWFVWPCSHRPEHALP